MPIANNTFTIEKSRTTRTYLEEDDHITHPPEGSYTRIAPRDKGKGKKIDVTNIPSSSTSISLSRVRYQAKEVTGSKVATQEPTIGKTSLPKDNTWQSGMRAITQEPTSIMEVEPQEPILHPDNTRIEEQSKLISSRIPRPCSRTLQIRSSQ